MALQAKREGIRALFVPEDNAAEATLADGPAVYPVRDVAQLVRHLLSLLHIYALPHRYREGMNKKELEGVVFDADGTLFDTERLGYWAWEEAGRQMGCPQAADCYPEVVGRGRGDVLALLPRLLGPDFPHEPFMELRSRLATERMERELSLIHIWSPSGAK